MECGEGCGYLRSEMTKKDLSPVVRKSQKLQREQLTLCRQLDMANERLKKAKDYRGDVLRRMKAKSIEARVFLSQYTAH